MKYLGNADFKHDAEPCAGVLLVNLGTPDAPTPAAVRRYLKEFLSDPRVVEFPRWAWWLILNLIILNVRPARSARAYAKIWTDAGSPLMVHSVSQTRALRQDLTRRFDFPVRVEMAMRYGTPSVAQGLEALHRDGARSIVVLPLYPQYSGSTVGSVFDAVAKVLAGWRWVPQLQFINSYHDVPAYIDALAATIRRHWQTKEQGECLLMSFHGVPQRYLTAGDPYHCQCHKSARLLAAALGLDADRWKIVFQSRFGREPWLQPYCDETLRQLAAGGVKRVDVVCPGFAADCLETLEEINMQNRELFLAAGGESLNYIPCLNDDPAHIALMSALVGDLVRDPAGGTRDRPDAVLERARAVGANR